VDQQPKFYISLFSISEGIRNLEFLNPLNFGCGSGTAAKIAVNLRLYRILQYGSSWISGIYIFISVHCTYTSRMQMKSDSDKEDDN